ncbi:MAG: START domain-containing protein [Bacteroidetes bacterium]|nr:START domain-containing protein [Bacteroidota bacterium]
MINKLSTKLNQIIKTAFVCFIIFVNPALSYAQAWELKENKNGVKVYTREVPGSDCDEFKGEVTVKTNLASLINIMDDFKNYPNWAYNCTYAEKVKKVSVSEGYAYSVLKTPWPVTDRDLVVHYVITQNPKTKVVTLKMDGVKGFVPDKGNVRMTYLKGFYQFTPIKNGYVQIVYQVHSDPAGSVPTSVVNSFVEDTPFNTLLNLKNKVENPKFVKTYRKEIVEF